MSKAYAKQKAEEKKRSSASSASSYQQTQQKYEQQKKQAEQDARRAAENFTRASTNTKYNQNLQAYMDRLNALKSYGYDVSKPTAQIQQEMKRIQPAVQAENRYTKALQEAREQEHRRKEARNSQPWAVRVGLVDPNEAEMTFGVYNPTPQERGRLSNAIAAGGRGWLAGQQNALGFALDPDAPDEAEMFFGKAPTSKLGEKISGKINQGLLNVSQRLYGAADIENAASQAHLDAAKKGLGKFGQTLVDVGVAGTQMALDAGIGAATGTGMASMGTRTFGQSAREALDSGATYQQAMDYGALSAAVELGTEKMFDVAKIFGGGGLDKAIEKWIVKYAKTPTGMTILRTIAGASGEGLEEIISSAVNPLLRSGYDPDALKDYGTSEYWADMLHEGLVGALLGGVGVAGNVITGGNARMVNEVNQEALNQRLQRAGAFNQAQRSMFAGNTMQTGTADAEAARVLARNSGTQGARDVATVRAAAQEQYGTQAKAVESVFEAGTADAETFQRQFQTAYDLGKSGAAMETAMNTPATAELNELQRENAWAIGREAGIREGTIKEEANTNGKTVRVRGSGERDAGQSAAGSVQQVESSAGSYQEGRSLGIGRSAKDSAAAGHLYSEEVKSLRDYGVKNGAVIKNLYELSEDSYEAAGLTEIKKEAEAHGYKLVAVAGLLHTQDAPGGWVTQSRGMVDEDTKTMFVQVDNVRFTASQIARHEDGHTKIDRGEISLKATKEAVEKALSPEEYHQALQDYADAYYGIDMTEEQAWVEIVCDAQGDMNIFEGLGDRFAEQRERLGRVLETTKKASQETAREGETRAPPEGGQKMSAELPNVDSEGNALTEQQAAFFANSKVRTDSGALKVMYRGGNTDIEVFDRRKSKPSNLYGRGFYFTDSEAQAKQYGNATPYYLNITNPLSPGQHEITRAQMRAFLEAVQENDEDYDFVNYGQGASVSSVLSDLFGKGDMEMLQDVNATAIGDLVAAVELFNEVNGTDYDGIIVPTETVAFRSEQIKRTDNKKPTGNANVKFSRELNLDEQRKRLAAMQSEYNEAERTRKELQKAPEFQQFMERIKSASNEEIPQIAAEYKEWEVESGLGEAARTSERLRGEITTLRGQIQRAEREALESAREEYRKKFTPEFAAKYAAKAARKFGTTSRFGLAGYLTTNGSLLDFSEGQGYRVQDHREIAEVLDFLPEDHEYSDGMIEFMNLGNVRLQSYGIDISKMPNAKQIPVLRRFFNSLDGEVTVDFSKENGNTDGSIDYPEGTRADRILADIKRYFDTGEVPELSTTQQFHFSRETDLDQLARENRALQKETDELRKAVQKWKGETKRTARPTLREQDVRKAAKQMLRDYNSKADAESVSAKLRQLGELIMNGENGEAAHWSDVRSLAEEIAEEIVNAESVNVNGDEFENFQLLTGVLKEKPIHVSEADLSDILAETGYETIGAFNRAYRGTVRITTEAAKAGDKTAQDAYYEMVEAMPGWFPEDVSEAEYVPRMLQVLEGLKPIYGMSEQTSANYEAAVTWAANDVIDRVLDESIRQNPKTFADRAQAKYDKERARLYQRIREVREQGNERVERTRREYTERSRKAIERMQARQEREIQRLKDRQREVRQNERERRGVTATWHKIQKIGASFRQMVEHPAQAVTKHAPRELAKALQGVADVFYTENRRRSDTTVNAAIQNLIVQFDALKDTEQGIYYDPMLAELNRAAEKALLNIPANQMTSEQVNAVYRMLKAHMQNITNANKFVTGKWAKGIWETGRDWAREVDGASPVMKGWTGDFLNWQLRPDSFFKRISGFVKDSVGERVQKMFSDGTEKMLRIQQDAYYTFRKFTESKDFDKLSKRGKKDLVDVGLKDANGKPVLLTRDMMLAVYMNLRNEQNLQAATYGGIEVPNFDEYYTGKTSTSYRHRTTTANVGGDTLELRNEQHDLEKALREGELTGEAAQEAQARLAEIADEIQQRAEEITGQMIRVRSNIANELTEYEKKFVETAAAWMQKSADYLNAETMAMYGIEKAQVPNYWPLHRDLSFVNTDMRTITDEINLENVGFLKERVQSRAPIMLAGFTFELENHTKKVSQYCGFAAVQRDFNKLYNTKLTREGSSLERKIRDKFGDEQRKMGASAQQYIDAYIAAVSGADKADATALSVIRRNLPRATLSLNLRVAVSQLASMPTAAAEVGWGSVVKGLPRGLKTAFSKKAKNELAQKNPWFWQRYRGEGGMREFADMHEAQNWFDRFYNKAASLPVMRNLLNWCQDFDVFATASMWAMSEEWVKSNTGLQPGTEEFDRAVGEKYADVIRKTQPNYTVTERSGLLRDKREGYKFLTMYKTQSNQNLNILYDANATLMKYKRDLKNGANGVTKADVKAAERQFARAYTAVIIGGSVTFAVLRAGANAILHAMNSYRDDDDELSIESVLNGILKETVGAIAGMFAFGSEIEELIMARITGEKYWGLSNGEMSAISDVLERGYKLTQGDASGEDWEKYIKSLMNALGVPYGNAKTVVSGFVNHIKDAQNGEFLSFEAGVNRTASQETNRILNGYLNGEGDKVKRAWDELLELKGGDENKAQETMRDGIKEAYMDGKITDKQALDMLKRYGGKDGDDGKEYLLKWQSIQDIGVEPSKIDDAYRDGEISKKQALSALMKYKRMTQEDAQTALDKADFAEKYGFDYSESNVQKAVVDGTITPDEAMKLWKQFGKQKDSHYESLLQQVEYMKKYPDVDPELIGTQSSKDYEDYGKAANIPAADFFQYWQDIHDLQGNDKRSQGIAYIDSLSISNDKKIALFLSFWAQSSLKYCPQSWFN